MSVVCIWSFAAYLVEELRYCDKLETAAFQFRYHGPESFHCGVVALEIVQQDDVPVFDIVEDEFLTGGRVHFGFPVIGSCAADECEIYHFMH